MKTIAAVDGQFIRLAGQHGSIIVSPLGYTRMGACGTPLRLPAVFGNSVAAEQQGFTCLMKERGIKLEYMEADANHGGMIPLVLPGIFKFFDRCRSKQELHLNMRRCDAF